MVNPKVKAVLAIVVSFMLGIVSGVFLVHFYWKPSPPIVKHHEFMQMVREKLELTAEQQAKIDSILCQSKRTIDEHKKAIVQIKDSVKTEIDKILTENQKKTLDELIRTLPPPRKN